MLEPDPTRVVPTHAGAPTGLDNPHALQILSTEHWSLLSARSLVYFLGVLPFARLGQNNYEDAVWVQGAEWWIARQIAQMVVRFPTPPADAE